MRGAGAGQLIFYITLAAVCIIMSAHYLRARKPVRTALKGMISGALALILLNGWGGIIGLYLPINLFNTLISLVLGIPGVIALAVIEKIIG